MPVETIIEDARWETADLAALAERAAARALSRLGLDAAGYDIAVLGCDDARIAALNADFRGKPQPTNVLSWPDEDLSPDQAGAMPVSPEPANRDDPVPLGDIAIAFDTCTRESAEQGKAFCDHVTHLLVHGVLHLLGYDHIRDADATVMEGLEVEILGKLGLGDPYSEDHG